MNEKEKEYVDYLIHNRTELTNQITKHLDTIILLQKKLDIATNALKDYADEENWSTATTEINTDYFKYEYSMYGLEDNGFIDAQKALKEIDSLGKCDKSHFFPSENVKGGVDE